MTATLFDSLTENSLSLKESIQAHLTHLLNAKHGELAHLPEYGLPDVTTIYQGLPYSADELTQSVKRCIEQFEPRIRNLQVTIHSVSQSDWVVKLDIHGQMLTGESIQFDTYFTADGEVGF